MEAGRQPSEEGEELRVALHSDATVLPLADVVPCKDCKESVPKKEAYKNSSAQGTEFYRCKPCNRILSRIERLKNTRKELVDGFQKLDPEARAAFLKAAGDLFKEGLKKELQEAITLSTIKKQSTLFRGEGDFKTKEPSSEMRNWEAS